MGQGSAYAVPQSAIERMLAEASQGLAQTRGFLNRNVGIPFVDTGIGFGNVMMGESPELLKDMSWGKSIVEPTGHGGRLDSRAADLLDVTAIGSILGKPAKSFLKAGLSDVATSRPLAKAEEGYIMGMRSKKADIAKLNKAERMKGEGKSADEIFEETKWWLDHPDGKPRFEVAHGNEDFLTSNKIRDLMQRINISETKTPRGASLQEAKMKDLKHMFHSGVTEYGARMKNSPVGDHYPTQFDDDSLVRIKSMFDTKSLGSYDESEELITIKNRPDLFEDKMLSTAQHETQHAISSIEKMSPGGSINKIKHYLNTIIMDEANPILNKIRTKQKVTQDEMRRALKGQKLNEMLRRTEYLPNDERSHVERVLFDLYQRISDESQARLVQSRAHMTQNQMDARPFFKEYPVSPKNMLTFNKYDGKIMK